MPSDPDEERHLDAAQGYADLGMYLEADGELDKADPYCRHQPEILRLRLEIYLKLERWELMQAVARKLVETEPEEAVLWVAWADATRRAQSLIHASEADPRGSPLSAPESPGNPLCSGVFGVSARRIGFCQRASDDMLRNRRQLESQGSG